LKKLKNLAGFEAPRKRRKTMSNIRTINGKPYEERAFEHKDFGVLRAYVGQDGEILFNLNDAASCLGHASAAEMLNDIGTAGVTAQRVEIEGDDPKDSAVEDGCEMSAIEYRERNPFECSTSLLSAGCKVIIEHDGKIPESVTEMAMDAATHVIEHSWGETKADRR
jgi:hypothetical protein